MKIRRQIISAFVILWQAFLFTGAKAADEGVEVGVGFGNNYIQSGGFYTFPTYVKLLYSFSMKAAIALSILMVVYAGYKYMTSKGDTSSINEAKDIIFSTLMGAALLMMVIFVGNLAGITIEIH